MLQGATFFDAGNIWMLRETTGLYETLPGDGPLSPQQQQEAERSIEKESKDKIFAPRHFFGDLATGTGVGLRYDLSFLVLRFDVGVGLHLPYDTGKKGYYNIPHFKDGMGYHLAIGYPF